MYTAKNDAKTGQDPNQSNELQQVGWDPSECKSQFLKVRKFSELVRPGTESNKPTSGIISTHSFQGESQLEVIERENYYGIPKTCEKATFLKENSHSKKILVFRQIMGTLSNEIFCFHPMKTDQSALPYLSPYQDHDVTSMPINRDTTEYCNMMPQPNLNHQPLVQPFQPK